MQREKMYLPLLYQKGNYMKNKMTNKDTKAIAEICKLLKECIIFDNIENREFICKNLNLIKDYKKDIPEDIYISIDSFINETIRPIVYDTNYFDFMIREEFGDYDENGHFVINSDHSLEMMIFLLYDRTLKLDAKIEEFASKQLNLKLK